MRNLFLMLAVLSLASAVYAADVTISCAQVGDTNEVTVSYDANAAANIPRAFALDIQLDNDETILSVTPLMGDEPNEYWVYPGTYPASPGSPIGDPCDSGDTLPGIDSNGITIEMASLHSPPEVSSPNAPIQSGDLLSFAVSGNCHVSISGNAARGKVVFYDATNEDDGRDVDYGSGCDVEIDCLYVGREFDLSSYTPAETNLVVTQAMVDKWKDPCVAEAACWCCTAQKVGNCYYTGASATRVDTLDLAAVKNSWYKWYYQAGYNPCCDFNLSGRVDTLDLAMLKRHWYQQVGPCPDP